ncbi:oxygen-dependent protoporphyrinogen oxidase [Labedaea rhizosphaerae]|uniref:Coproporphyrinogen III oxidase n=1 Tax=Labedaea rhizosphaerae TaxID=598644 RepID=A0A4V3CXY7_LABRH|nr:oxygen-dependent protoporphyrinogen oxidase [Labedaea rhizosphaerae]
MSGLAAAHRLRTLLGPGVTITVLEQAAQVGGKLRTVSIAGRCYDVGAEAFLARRPEALALVDELGLTGELEHPAPVASRVRAGGRTAAIPRRTVLGVPSDPDELKDLLSPAGLRRAHEEAGLPPIDLTGRDAGLGELLDERFGPEVADRLVDPLLGGVYAGGVRGLGLRATVPQLAAALDDGAPTLTAAATAALPKPSANPAPVFGTLRGGLGSLVAALVAESKADVHCGVTVRSLRHNESGWTLGIGSVPSGQTMTADAVVLAVPAPAARKLLDPVAPVASAAFAEIEVASMAVVGLALPADTVLPESSGTLIGRGERHADGTPFAAKAFTFSARKWAHLGGGGPVLVRGSVGRHREPGALKADDEELVRLVRADLAELTGITTRPLDTVVQRWGGGLPQYGVGHLDLADRIGRAVAAVPRLAIAGAALNGVGIPACIGTARAAAERLAQELKQ